MSTNLDDNALTRPGRRGFLTMMGGAAAAIAAAGCAPAASAPAAPAAANPASAARPAWEAEWDKLVAAAKSEGLVTMMILASQVGGKQTLEDFEKTFPGIRTEFTTFTAGNLFSARAMTEQKAGVHSWDLAFAQASSVMLDLKPADGLTPIRPLLFRPDVVDDKAWRGGFESGFVDKEKRWGFGFLEDIGAGFWINTDMVKEGEIKSARDLLDPKWKGKMAFPDPRLVGFSWVPATSMRLALGDSFLTQLFVDQQPQMTRDTNQITEWMVRGQYAIALGVLPAALAKFRSEGLGGNLKEVRVPEALNMTIGHQAWAMNKMPHPNAGKLFINWLLTKQGQESWSKAVLSNSKRTDVAPATPERQVDPNVKYWYIQGPEETIPLGAKTQEIAQQILK